MTAANRNSIVPTLGVGKPPRSGITKAFLNAARVAEAAFTAISRASKGTMHTHAKPQKTQNLQDMEEKAVELYLQYLEQQAISEAFGTVDFAEDYKQQRGVR